MTTVIISEKDEFTRLGLKSALQATEEIRILGDYDTDEMMLSELSSLNPDVVILGGTEDILARCRICQEVRTLCPTAKVLTLSDKQNDDDLYEIIMAGASGDVLKSAGSAEMVRSVGVVACGGLNFDNDVLIRLLSRIPKQRQDHQTNSLSERERMIVAMIAKDYTDGQIGRALNLSRFTIRNSVGEIRGKLDMKSRTELAAFAGQYGLLNEPEIISGNEDASTETD